jgi:PAS domain S-box-containing protein
MLQSLPLNLPPLFTDLFNNTVQNNIIILNTGGVIQAVNPAFTKCFGYKPNDIIGKNMSVLFTPEDCKLGLPQKELQNVLSTGQGSDNNYLVAADNTQTWVSGESVLVKQEDGSTLIFKIIQNIHVQKESELELGRINLFNEDILGSISDVVIVLNEKMEIVKTNKAFAAVFNTIESNSADRNFKELINPHDTDNVLINSIGKAFTGGSGFSNTVVTIAISETERRIFEASGTPMLSVTGTNSILLVLHDITLHKELEREREDIMGFVAHELRNPLSNLGLCQELLGMQLEEKNYDAMPAMLQRNQNNLQRLNKMIAELYNATKINSGNIVLDKASYHFGEMVQEATETIHLLQPDYNITVTGDGNFIAEGDRYRMMEVVTNYLNNGIKYSAGSTEVVLNIEQHTEKVTVSVKDKGLGISASQLPYIFERFFRAEKTKNLEGLGLGLYLCQRIIQAHGGKVWAESEEGKGSVFYFSVPLQIH